MAILKPRNHNTQNIEPVQIQWAMHFMLVLAVGENAVVDICEKKYIKPLQPGRAGVATPTCCPSYQSPAGPCVSHDSAAAGCAAAGGLLPPRSRRLAWPGSGVSVPRARGWLGRRKGPLAWLRVPCPHRIRSVHVEVAFEFAGEGGRGGGRAAEGLNFFFPFTEVFFLGLQGPRRPY